MNISISKRESQKGLQVIGKIKRVMNKSSGLEDVSMDTDIF